MKKIKEYLGVISYPVLLLFIELGIITVFTVFFNLNTNNKVGTIVYQQELSNFLNSNKIFIVIITFLALFFPIFKKNRSKFNKISKNNIIVLLLVGLCMSLTYNLLLYAINLKYNFTNLFDNSNSNIIILLITAGILGPILEELIFRGIVYERLNKLVNNKISVIITGLLFGLFHGNLIQFIYAFLLNLILIESYKKYKSIYAPIIIHISANSFLTILLPFIKHLDFIWSIVFLFIFLIVLINLLKSVYKKDFNG